MTTSALRTCMTAGAFLLTTAMAQAAVVVNNAPNQDYGTNMSFALVADDFSLASTYDINTLRFWTLQSSAADYSGSVYWAIYSDATGPSSVLFSGTANATGATTGGSAFGYAEYVYDITVNFQLAAGTYWLALQNGPLGNTNATEMIWESSDTGGGTGLYKDFQLQAPQDWLAADFNHAFAILGDRTQPPNPTPTPGTLALLIGGLAGLGAIRRQRQPA